MQPSGTRTPPRRTRRWLYAGAAVALLGVAVLVVLFAVYPRVGASMIREKIGERLGTRLGREVTIRRVEVALGHAVLRDLEVRGPRDGGMALVHVDRIDIEFDTWKSLVGTAQLGAVEVDGVVVTLRRTANGEDNLRDALDKLRAERGKGTSGGGKSLRPTSITVTRIKVLADDAVTGATALVGNGSATWTPHELVATIEDVTATTVNAPRASAKSITVRKQGELPPAITIVGGEVAIIPALALSGIEGTISANPQQAGTYTVDLAGGYGGVPGKLWTAKGAIEPAERSGTLDLVAAKFQLDRLASLLEHSPIVDYAATSIDTSLHLQVVKRAVTFASKFTLRGLNVGHPLIADKEVHDLDLAGDVAGTFDLATRTLELSRGDFEARGVPFSVTGRAHQLTKAQVGTLLAAPPVIDAKGDVVKRIGPANLEQLDVHVVIPPLDCQKFLTAIPPEMVPYMQGYRMKGTFDTDLTVAIDWANLDATRLDGHVGIKNCKVVGEPDDGPKHLEKEFEHFVEVEEGEWMSFVVGPTNEDFVPLADISPFLISSVMTTEDNGFYKHRGYITSEFRSALISNLKAGKFRRGASSITMQFVKNVLLYREKTLLRKLQELFLTWHVEHTLTKDRILEIYFNVIEFGPALYGIGPAMKHFFGKSAKDMTATEAAFFSTILPSPKERYKQYCAGTLNKWSNAKIGRILALMRKRDRITEEQYQTALATPLAFVKDETESEEDCLKRVKKAIKNARSTNPLAPPKPARDGKRK